MSGALSRRKFLGVAAGAATMSMAAGRVGVAEPPSARIGVIGVGNRGSYLFQTLLSFPGVRVPAVCDTDPEAAARAVDFAEKAGQAAPETYTGGEVDYRRLLERDDLDAVIIATPWNWHTPMALDAMRAGKQCGVEVPIATSVEECWQLIRTQEATGTPCVMLENWSFRRDNLAVLRMMRAGLLGETVHAQCAYAHDCIGYYFRPGEKEHWGVAFLEQYNRDQYPTHALGPVLSWLDINCGDAFASLSSTATDARGINAYFRRTGGAAHPNATRKFAQGDIVHTVIRTEMGKTITVNYDVLLPRPYDNQWLLQGTGGVYSHEHDAVYLEGRSPAGHAWEAFAAYQQEFDHPWWTSLDQAAETAGHGGTDSLELGLFVASVREKQPFPLDLIDAVTMSSVIGLSGESIAQGGRPVTCPDFSQGGWKTRKPGFGLIA